MESKIKTNGTDSPTVINVMKFIKSRAQEIAMTVVDAKKKYPKLMSQQLPFHMRRRSVSHNIKRLPRRLRDKLTPEAEKIQAKRTKRPSRKYRRRPSNISSEYERRARKNVWLETHIWFAKRFKMIEKWGYMLPLHSNDKSFRASYRATTKHCLIQDTSYYSCIELFGPEENLLTGLNQLTSSNLGLTFAAKMYLNGTREGYCVVYHPKTFPYKAIGPVSFLWKPKGIVKGTQSVRQLWIWCHPTIYDEMKDVLILLFNFKIKTKLSSNLTHMEPPSKKLKIEKKSQSECGNPDNVAAKEDEVIESNLKTKIQRPSKYTCEENVEMILLKDQLVRFSLHGPLSQAVLNDSLRLTSSKLPEENVAPDSKSWWHCYYKDEENLKVMESQNSLWKQHASLGTSAELAIGPVLGLTVRDPRFSLPIKKTKAIPDSNEEAPKLVEYPSEVCNSPLWQEEIRENVKSTMLPTNQVNNMRNEFFQIHGEKLDGLGCTESRIPLIIIQNSGVANYSSNGRGGCDVILPSGWAMPFWIAFIYREARVGGLRESESIGIEEGVPIFPEGYPDSTQGRRVALEKRTELWTQHFKYPPNKRPNFEILGVLSPFYPLWSDLVTQWSQKFNTNAKGQDFYVLRDRSQLKLLSDLLDKPQEEAIDNLIKNCLDSSLKEAIVYVKIKCEKGASASQFACICLPTNQEMVRYKMTNKMKGPIEHSHKTLAKEKSKTKNAKTYVENIPNGSGLVDSCSRKIIGYVVAGNFSFSNAIKTGNGFCSYLGLLAHMKSLIKHRLKLIALLREQHSVNYHFATILVPICL